MDILGLGRKFYRASAGPGVFFFALIWLMVLVTVGTIAQKYIGLYRAQEIYFSSWYFWAGPIPLPGAMPVMAIIFFGLLTKLISFSRWKRQQLGINILHIGSAALLLGGFITALYSQEGGLVVGEGETVDFVSEYNRAEFVAVYRSSTGQDSVFTIPFSQLRSEHSIDEWKLPFRVSTIRTCANCEVARRSTKSMDHRGFAANFDLVELPADPEHEKNQRGILFRVSTEDPNIESGIYAVYEFMPVVQTIALADGAVVSFHLRRLRHSLPFSIQLVDFRRSLHPGTETARSYESDVVLIDGTYRKEVTIRMNEPLRYKGYTLFQSSFDLSGEKEVSVFAVVKNVGWLFPYVSSLIMALGLFLHLCLQVPALIAREGSGSVLGGSGA